QPVDNLRLFADDARLLLPRLPGGCLGRVYLLFPDPWPKLRHHRRRFVSPSTSAELARLMADGAELRIATDHAGYARWSLSQLCGDESSFAWTARRPADWRHHRPVGWRPATSRRR
ncbi:MAG: tRNA (guanosine(46)-N7)-methyltransferase TrmB, partial [Rhodospirillales bacterium]|nr:tRNA (guanosine(46)-N7)-methyltransferase TrmB [Rhodospirillales bacterium]